MCTATRAGKPTSARFDLSSTAARTLSKRSPINGTVHQRLFSKSGLTTETYYTLSRQSTSTLPEGEWRLESVKQFKIGPDR